MFRRIGRVIMNNFGLKVLAAVFAVILWLAIVNVADPNTTATFTVPVTIEHPDYLADQGMTYEILDNTDEFTFTVEGPRSVVEELSEDESFTATADLEKINDSLTEVKINLEINNAYSNRLEITSPQPNLLLQVEARVTEEFDIEVVTDGAPAADCYVESAQAKPSTVTVEGPQSLVEQIASAQVSVNVDEAEEDVSSEGTIVLLGENGAELDKDRLTLDVNEVEASVKIFMTKEVPLRFNKNGEPAEGYWSAAPECNVDSVAIEGDASTIRDTDEIEINSERLDVTNAEQDITVQLTLSNYLPDGVTLAEGEPDSIEVTLPIVEAYVAEVEMPTDNLSAANLADGLTMTIQGDSIPVTLTGPKDIIDSVNANRLKGTVDASGYGEGSYDLPVDVETDGTYDAEATASVNITKTEE